ncbi:hypothetical protein F4677DRAFT_161235 [Hypoxylon crocopeplum]|nr:hypothetical protein F4677DRAFT_161235 [Hypoxylon crocopeplum]
MSLPPQLIRVKRKATEDAPVSFLRVQESKRHRSDAFVYQRQEERAKFAENIPPELTKPVIHTSKPRVQTPAFQNPEALDTGITDKTSSNGVETTTPAGATPAKLPGVAGSGVASEPRRFHMSRKDLILAASTHPGRSHGGISKKRSAPTLFVERRIKRISSRPLEKLQAITNALAHPPTSTPAATEEMEVDKPEPRKYKKPGVAKFAKKVDGQKSLTERLNVDTYKITAEMDAFIMETIGISLQKAEDEKALQSAARTQPKFKPKPIMRYAERHPESVQAPVDADMTDADVDISDSDDGDYIIETYERVPASKMGEHVPLHSIGVLVFDEEPDMEFFYGEGGDSDDEWAEDEEDENAENYYAADYPDEEVASDDEFGRNPYSFRNGNASDLEEYDLEDDDDDAAFSDKDDPSSRFKTYISKGGLRTNHL